MSDRVNLLLDRALQALDPEERDELLREVLLGQLGRGTSPPAGVLGSLAAPSAGDVGERVTSLLGAVTEAPAGARMKVLPIRLPEADHDRLRRFCQASGFSMAVVIRTLVERFLDQHGVEGGQDA